MTATVVRPPSPDMLNYLHYSVESTFASIDPWILNSYTVANIPSATMDAATAEQIQTITHIAQTQKDQRLSSHELFEDQTIIGVEGNVDGHGQCLFLSRNQLLNVNDSPQVERHQLMNELLADPDQLIGTVTARQLFFEEYGMELRDTPTFFDFREKYVKGEKQAGCLELLYYARKDSKNYVVVSHVEETSVCALKTTLTCNRHPLRL